MATVGIVFDFDIVAIRNKEEKTRPFCGHLDTCKERFPDLSTYQRINDGYNYEIVNATCTYSNSAGLDNKRRTCLRQAGSGLLTVKATSKTKNYKWYQNTHKTLELNTRMGICPINSKNFIKICFDLMGRTTPSGLRRYMWHTRWWILAQDACCTHAMVWS